MIAPTQPQGSFTVIGYKQDQVQPKDQSRRAQPLTKTLLPKKELGEDFETHKVARKTSLTHLGLLTHFGSAGCRRIGLELGCMTLPVSHHRP